MKVLFWADNEPVFEMFKPIKALLKCQSVIIRRVDAKVVEREKPDLIVLAREETTPLEHSIANSGIPTLLVPHGALMPNERELWFGDGRYGRVRHLMKLARQARSRLGKGDMSLWSLLRTGLFRIRNDFRDGATLSRYDGYTKIAAYGEAMRDILIRYRVKPENIVVTGNPKYDKYLDMRPNKDKEVLLITDYLVEFGLWSKKQRLGYLRDVCEVVYEVTGQNTEVLIHPVVENKVDYVDVVKRNGLTASVHQMELTRLIEECAVGITLLSTSGLEVMVAGKPLVIYNPYGNPTMYHERSGVYIAKTKSELLATVGSLLRNGMDIIHRNLSDDYVYKQMYLRDGKADKRIADLIMSMVGQNEKQSAE